MTPLTWIPEAYPKSGGLAAAGFYKLLGRPRLDPLTVLVRETAQNSWDARMPGHKVWFGIEGWSPLLTGERDTLRNVVFADRAKTGTRLTEALSKESVDGLIIFDRGTRGLGGPTTADRFSADGVYDWVDFVLNVGKPNPQVHTGGTYGFGKTITYITSAANAIVIHSRTMVEGRPETRLIGCAIGKEFDQNERLHTGRHWWGVAEDGIPLPASGTQADEIAAAIGMPEFEGEELGTNILVISPDFGGRTPVQAMNFIAESVTWHLWPKLMPRAGEPPMDVSVSLDGEPVPVPHPQERPPLHGFSQAFQALLDGVDEGRRADGLERRVVRAQRPKWDVGDLVTVPLVARPRHEVDDGHDASQEDSPPPAAAITGVCHHVALLRAPELVVDYLAGPTPVDAGTEWAAVFKCRDDVDEYFALAEPPTHDSWKPDLLEKSTGKTIVKVGLQRIREFLEDRWGAPIEIRKPATLSSTAIVADELAYLIRSSPSIGPGRPAGVGGGGGGGGRNARVEVLSTGVEMQSSEPVTTTVVRVTPKRGSAGTTLRISVGVAVDDRGADPDLDPFLRLIEARYNGTVTSFDDTSGVIELTGDGVCDVTLVVIRGDDSAVQFDIHPEAVDP